MPVFEVFVKCNILAKNEQDAKYGFCNYVAEDLGIECLNAKLIMTDKHLIKEVEQGYDPHDYFDYEKNCGNLVKKLHEIEDEQ